MSKTMGNAMRQANRNWIRGGVCAILLVAAGGVTATAVQGEEAWSPVIIARGAYREQIVQTPIEQRPNRPFHFYGNTIRRRHHRGTPFPLPSDFLRTIEYAATSLIESVGRPSAPSATAVQRQGTQAGRRITRPTISVRGTPVGAARLSSERGTLSPSTKYRSGAN
jgi:hypothetical protein